jgi:hypothetical protein
MLSTLDMACPLAAHACAQRELASSQRSYQVGAGLSRDENRHCERSEAIHLAARTEWIASSLLLLAMTAKSAIEDEIITP